MLQEMAFNNLDRHRGAAPSSVHLLVALINRSIKTVQATFVMFSLKSMFF